MQHHAIKMMMLSSMPTTHGPRIFGIMLNIGENNKKQNIKMSTRSINPLTPSRSASIFDKSGFKSQKRSTEVVASIALCRTREGGFSFECRRRRSIERATVQARHAVM